MEIISSYLQQGVSFIVPLVILLGLLIFVHELGHFAVAKYFGVRVEVFSLGFGKKIFSLRRGDTEYCISIIPLGGYVKMFGDDPKAPIPEDQKQFSFNHKPVWPRIAIVLAGPLMNLFFAFLLFMTISVVGESVLLPVVGDIQPKSQAYLAGFRSGDTITAVNKNPIQKWEEFDQKIKESAGRSLQVEVKQLNGQANVIEVTPTLVANKNVLSDLSHVGEIEGVTYIAKASSVGLLDPTSLGGVAGFKTGDVIVSMNGTSTERWMDLERAAFKYRDQSSFKFEIERGENLEKKSIEIPIADVSKSKHGEEVLEKLGLHSPDLFISKVLPNSAAGEAGILEGDKIISVGGTSLREWNELVEKVRAFDETKSKILKVSVLRDGVERNFDVMPKKIKQMNSSGKEEENYAIGIVPSIVSAMPLTFIEKTSDPIKAAGIGITNSWVWTKTICISFLRLFQNRVSPKSIGGPIMIGQLASETFKIGISPFMKIMAIISINLFVLNLLPVPVLDGGHLVFFTVEALRGAPLSIQKMEMAQQVGLVLLLGLMVLALFNDITRLIGL